MAKDPAMLWYWNDWHSGTVLLSRFLKGCYMDLLHAQFNHGHLSFEEIKMCLNGDFEAAWEPLKKKFKVDESGFFFNEKLDAEKLKRKVFSESRRSNLSKKPHMDKHMKPHMDSHMENENINENKDEMLIYNIEEFLLKNESQFEKVCMGVYKTKEEVLPSLKLYHLWNVENAKYPKQVLQLIAGLQKWVLNQKQFSNGTHKRNVTGNSKSAGADEVTERLAAKLAARGKANT